MARHYRELVAAAERERDDVAGQLARQRQALEADVVRWRNLANYARAGDERADAERRPAATQTAAAARKETATETELATSTAAVQTER